MAEERPTLHIDTDWKKQAQEEKRRLAEEQAKAAAAPPPAAPLATPPMVESPADTAATAPGDAAGGKSARKGRPTASFGTLVQALLTQALFYMGEIATQGTQPIVNLDMAKHQIDMLNILEEKTANNLNEDERRMLDAALYDVRTRFVTIASQYL